MPSHICLFADTRQAYAASCVFDRPYRRTSPHFSRRMVYSAASRNHLLRKQKFLPMKMQRKTKSRTVISNSSVRVRSDKCGADPGERYETAHRVSKRRLETVHYKLPQILDHVLQLECPCLQSNSCINGIRPRHDQCLGKRLSGKVQALR